VNTKRLFDVLAALAGNAWDSTSEQSVLVMNEATQLLNAIAGGDPQAAAKLLPLVYEELRRLAARRLAQETPGQTLDATGLVHEAYLRLVGAADENRWKDRGHFFAAAAEAMRHILVDKARRKRRAKHGGGRKRVMLDDVASVDLATEDDLLSLDEALTRLGAEDAEAAAVVQLRYFAGLSVEQAAQSLGISRATAYRHWTFARAWLRQELTGSQ
jgi:RNA polymerase sigma factor (TIGR02999 family)